ncbi:MAG: hypothetical protein ABR567_10730, partial [Myxococcales bacterium]
MKEQTAVATPSLLEFTLPLCVKGPNFREHPMSRHRRVKNKRGLVEWNFVGFRLEDRRLPTLP